ncbi:MAG: UDP-N-acetylglucosamine--N-acetylmuramyl-(pentapeptide) pyrophosphoryl-undecaprenol N-acetylglucosamine transferase [Candidatus Nanopelagicales bacterium]
MALRVVVAGGGTAGHVEPALNLADALVAAHPGSVVTALGTAEGLETRLVPARGYELDLIPRVPLPRRPSGDLATLPVRLRTAIRATREVFARRQADVVVGFGGFVALPAYLAARGRLPIVVHEANAKAGLANKVGRRFTPYVAEATLGSLPGAVRIGIPLRESVAHLDRPARRPGAGARFGLDPARRCLLVFGGSQGARSLNAAVVAAAPHLLAAGVQILHGYGARNADQVEKVRDLPGYVALDYIDGMDDAYAAADMAVCRAGAMTCAELAAVGLPALYVPLPIGNGEQRFNATPVVDAGGGLMMTDADLSGDTLTRAVLPILSEEGRLEEMSQAAAAHGVRDAAARLADMVISAAGKGQA